MNARKKTKRRKKDKYIGIMKSDTMYELNNIDRVNKLKLPFKTQR